MGNRVSLLLLLLQIMGAAYVHGLQQHIVGDSIWSIPVVHMQQHIVGDSIWSIPPTYDFYTNWSSSHSFHTGDTLYFDFDSGLYNVIQVSRGEFDSCSGNQPLDALMDGPAVFPLSRKGVFYFVCNVSNYCWLGQKVSVIVDEEQIARSDSPSPSPD